MLMKMYLKAKSKERKKKKKVVFHEKTTFQKLNMSRFDTQMSYIEKVNVSVHSKRKIVHFPAVINQFCGDVEIKLLESQL